MHKVQGNYNSLQVRAVKIYVAALEALRKNEKSWSKQDETQDKFLSYKFIGHDMSLI
jgi:hypothetical protein